MPVAPLLHKAQLCCGAVPGNHTLCVTKGVHVLSFLQTEGMLLALLMEAADSAACTPYSLWLQGRPLHHLHLLEEGSPGRGQIPSGLADGTLVRCSAPSNRSPL